MFYSECKARFQFLVSYYGHFIYQPNIILKLQLVSFNSYYYRNRKQNSIVSVFAIYLKISKRLNLARGNLLNMRNRLFAFGVRCKEWLVQSRYNATKQTANSIIINPTNHSGMRCCSKFSE